MRYEDYITALASRWLQWGIGPREAATKLQPACGNVALDDEELQRLENLWQQSHDALLIIFGIIGGWKRLTGFDCEDVVSPVDHAHIVRYLTAITSNMVALDDIKQSVEPNGDLKILMTLGAEVRAFTFKDHGSWCNLSGLLAGLNSLLDDRGILERFIELYAGDGPGVVAFVLPDKFLPAARELGIQLESISPG